MDETKPRRNGRFERIRERKVSLWVSGVSLFFTISFFLAPLTLPTDTVPDLSGRANTIDYASIDGWGSWGNHQQEEGGVGHNQTLHGGKFAWSTLNPYAAFIYAFGDFNCHQKHERSWELRGNQLPVCTRDIGIFAGASLGALLFLWRGLNRWTVTDTMLSVIPEPILVPVYLANRRKLIVWSLVALLALPMILDGGLQMVTSHESNNLLRPLTGLPFGMLVTLWFTSSLSARPNLFEGGASDVLLPGGARFEQQPTKTKEADEQSY